MTTLDSLYLENRLLFRKAKLQLNREGLTVIMGRNAAHPGQARQTNMVGKSLLTSQILDIGYPDGATGKAKDRLRKGRTILRLTKGSGQYKIVQDSALKTDRFQVTRNTEDRTPKDPTDQRAYVSSLFGMSKEVFTSTYYLDHKIGGILRTGDTAQRRDFFTEFFDLGQADDIRKKILLKREAIRMDNARLSELLKQDNSEYDEEDLRAQLTKAKRLLSKYKGQLATLRSDSEYQEFLRANAYALSHVSETYLETHGIACEGLEDTSAAKAVYAKFVERLKQSRSRISSVAVNLATWAIYDRAVEERNVIIRKRKAIKAEHGEKYPELLTHTPDQIRDLLYDAEDACAKVNRAIDQQVAAASRLNADRKEARVRVTRLEAELASLRENGPTGTCSHCGQALNAAGHKKEVQAIKKELAKWQEVYEAAVDAFKEADARTQELTEARVPGSEVSVYLSAVYEIAKRIPEAPPRPQQPEEERIDEEEAAEIESTRDDIDRLWLQIQNMRSADPEGLLFTRFLLGDRGPVGDPSHPNGLLPPEELAERNRLARERLERQHRKNGTLDQMAPEITRDEDDLVALVDKYRTRVGILRVQLEDAAGHNAQVQERVKRIKELKEAVKLEKHIDTLEKAFAATGRGVKQILIRSKCKALESRVNYYAAQLFSEKYTFHFDMDSQFTITANRYYRTGKSDKSGKPDTRIESSDVRKLSGAESAVFDLCVALALISFMPAKQRMNVMVLDELDGNFGPAMMERFRDFLPKLREIVPHIIIVTPKNTDYGPDAVYFTVVRDGEYSTLEEGRV